MCCRIPMVQVMMDIISLLNSTRKVKKLESVVKLSLQECMIIYTMVKTIWQQPDCFGPAGEAI